MNDWQKLKSLCDAMQTQVGRITEFKLGSKELIRLAVEADGLAQKMGFLSGPFMFDETRVEDITPYVVRLSENGEIVLELRPGTERQFETVAEFFVFLPEDVDPSALDNEIDHTDNSILNSTTSGVQYFTPEEWGKLRQVLECWVRYLDEPSAIIAGEENGKPGDATADQTVEHKRKRSTKAETAGKVMQAISHKLQHPEANEKKCAESADIPNSTLNRDQEWQKWFSLIEQAHSSGHMAKVKREFDSRSGGYLIEDKRS